MQSKKSWEEFLKKDYIKQQPLVLILDGDEDWSCIEKHTKDGIITENISHNHRIVLNEIGLYCQLFIEPREEYIFFKEVQGNKYNDQKEIETYAIPYKQIIRVEQDDEEYYFIDYWGDDEK